VETLAANQLALRLLLTWVCFTDREAQTLQKPAPDDAVIVLP